MGHIGGRRGKFRPAVAGDSRPEVDLLTAACREPDVVEIQSVGALRTRRREADVQLADRLLQREAHPGQRPGVVGRSSRIGQRFPALAVGADRKGHVARLENRPERKRVVGLGDRQRDMRDREIGLRRVVEQLGIGLPGSTGVLARRTEIVVVDAHVVDLIAHRRGSRPGLGFPLLIAIGPDPAGSVAEIEREERIVLNIRPANDLHGFRLGVRTRSGSDGQHATLARRNVADGDHPVARTRGGREFERRIGTRSLPRSIGSYRNAILPRGVEIQVAGSDRERHPDSIGGTGHGDRLARGLARGGAHAHLNGSALGHVPHVEHPVTGTRDGFHPDGSRLGRPENLPPGVGDHTDRIVRRSRFVEGERCGFNGGIALVRRVVAAARGEQQQAQGERP